MPSIREWVKLGFGNVQEIEEGEQSRVFTAEIETGPVVVKLTDAALADITLSQRRMSLMSDLADAGHAVAVPVLVGEALVCRWGRWLITATRFVDGVAPDLSDRAHCELMGEALASLHQTMSELPKLDLPAVASLRVGQANTPYGPWQLLHGDFNSTNLRLVDGDLYAFDFDDCGYGPVELDVANSLYMVLFDSLVDTEAEVNYKAFHHSFLEGYRNGVHKDIPIETVEHFINHRVDALRYWLDNLSEAPIGIQTSGPEWLATLRRFVDSWPMS